MPRIGFATCADPAVLLGPAEEPLFAEGDYAVALRLRQMGHEVIPVVWDAPEEGGDPAFLAALDVLVVRSTWDYFDSEDKKTAFHAWLATLEELQTQTRVLNTPQLMRWNMNKSYLQELEQAGCPSIPTTWIDTGGDVNDVDLVALWEERQAPFVVKPAISGSAVRSFRFESLADVESWYAKHSPAIQHGQEQKEDEEQRQEQEQEQERSFCASMGRGLWLVQPFLREVTTLGEWSMVFIRGQYTCAVHKLPKAEEWRVQQEHGGIITNGQVPPERALAAATEIMQRSLPQAYKAHCADTEDARSAALPPLYARVDMIVLETGEAVLGELELIEPELYLDEAGETRFAEAIALEADRTRG